MTDSEDKKMIKKEDLNVIVAEKNKMWKYLRSRGDFAFSYPRQIDEAIYTKQLKDGRVIRISCYENGEYHDYPILITMKDDKVVYRVEIHSLEDLKKEIE